MAVNFKRLSLLISILIFFTDSLAYQDELPDLGETSHYQLKQEKQIGQAGLEYLGRYYSFETHPLLHRYISQIGEQLLTASGHDPREYQFLLIKDKAVNAMALPGGFIGINVGLIMKTSNQDELAAVIAHEIAHVQLRHGMKMKKRFDRLATTKSVLHIFNHIPSPHLVVTLPTSINIAQRDLIKMRHNEIEADRHGMKLLKKAGFNPRGMESIFGRITESIVRARDRSETAFSTHPPLQERIGEIRFLWPDENNNETGMPRNVYENFSKFKDSIQLDYGMNPTNRKASYQRALIAQKTGNFEFADKLLRPLYHSDPENEWHAIAYAENLEILELHRAAEQVYRDWLAIFPGDPLFTGRLAALLKKTGRFKEALHEARKLEKRYPDNQRIQFELAEIYKSLGNNGLHLMAKANYARLVDDHQFAEKGYSEILESDADPVTIERARYQISNLKNNPKKDSYQSPPETLLATFMFCIPSNEPLEHSLQMEGLTLFERSRLFGNLASNPKKRPKTAGHFPAF